MVWITTNVGPNPRPIPPFAAFTGLALLLVFAPFSPSLSSVSLAQETPPADAPISDDSEPDDSEPQIPLELRSAVAEALDGLDAGQLAKRQAAEKQLLELGAEVLPLLPPFDNNLSAEAQQRLRRVRRMLEQMKAESDAEALIIRLGRVTTLDEALTRITDVSGVKFQLAGPVEQPLALTLGAMPFWSTLDTVLDAANLEINFYAGNAGEIGLVPRPAGKDSRTNSAAYAGVYRLETTAVNTRRDFRSPQLSGLNVSTEIAWEPRLTPIGLNLPLNQVVAILDDGQKLVPEEGQIYVSANASIPFSQININLPLPSGAPRKIDTLTGVLRSMLPGAKDHFKVDLATKHEEESVGNLTFLVEEVRPNGELFEVRVEVLFANPGNSLESHRQWIFENPAYVITTDGTRLEHLGYQTYRQTADRVGIAYMFDLDNELTGKTFHYESPISIIESEVTFVMKDILLP